MLPQRDKSRMFQVPIRRPLGELDLGDQLGSDTDNRGFGLIDGESRPILGVFQTQKTVLLKIT
jgi:hypothetical protein